MDSFAWAELDQAIADLREGVERWRRNNPRPPPRDDAVDERAALIADVRTAILDDLYPPEGCEHERDFHLDLPAFSLVGLRDERDRLRLRLYLESESAPWLIDRLERIEAERASRQRSG